MGLIERLGGSEIARVEWNSTVSKNECVQRLQSFRRGCLLTEENK